MGKPAARMGDSTAHGGVITVGCPTVLIGGQPAARMGDMHMCPMLNPGTPPPPHVGGAVMLGSPLVLIGGMPAARMGDMAMCMGPPDTIVGGCPTVLIGEGPGSGGGAGGGAGQGGSAASAPVLTGTPGQKILGKHWVEYKFVDSNNLPLAGVKYLYKDVAGAKHHSSLSLDGRIYKGGLADEGKTQAELYGLKNPHWSKDTAKADEKLTLETETFGLAEGLAARIDIWVTDIEGPDYVIKSIQEIIKGKKISTTWALAHASGADLMPLAIAPDFYFTVSVGTDKARSGPVRIRDWVDIEFKNEQGKSIANAEYELLTPAGDVRRGKTGGTGKAREENLSPAKIVVNRLLRG